MQSFPPIFLMNLYIILIRSILAFYAHLFTLPGIVFWMLAFKIYVYFIPKVSVNCLSILLLCIFEHMWYAINFIFFLIILYWKFLNFFHLNLFLPRLVAWLSSSGVILPSFLEFPHLTWVGFHVPESHILSLISFTHFDGIRPPVAF